ncbi:uncharacterized protein LOC117786927 [Drosophila innubila]|uniref:uncharacterized protein LOC117786927 n=1 Tax=Drosophila innubila TaxID=198719 RepID=UPI00148E730F|nr:uncharacterized protein LOC117786927 [Drosophila innubila]
MAAFYKTLLNVLRTACHSVGRAGWLIGSQGRVPSLARSPNNRLHHRYTNSCGERNYTTLQQKTTEIHNINNKTCNQQQNGKIPVPDPGVPALPEMTPLRHLPHVGHRMDLLHPVLAIVFLSPPTAIITRTFSSSDQQRRNKQNRLGTP